MIPSLPVVTMKLKHDSDIGIPNHSLTTPAVAQKKDKNRPRLATPVNVSSDESVIASDGSLDETTPKPKPKKVSSITYEAMPR